jgi:hypothetical protein
MIRVALSNWRTWLDYFLMKKKAKKDPTDPNHKPSNPGERKVSLTTSSRTVMVVDLALRIITLVTTTTIPSSTPLTPLPCSSENDDDDDDDDDDDHSPPQAAASCS